jgi:hypothetical protein
MIKELCFYALFVNLVVQGAGGLQALHDKQQRDYQ